MPCQCGEVDVIATWPDPASARARDVVWRCAACIGRGGPPPPPRRTLTWDELAAVLPRIPPAVRAELEERARVLGVGSIRLNPEAPLYRMRLGDALMADSRTAPVVRELLGS